MNELALFTGIGGGLLATQQLLGWRTVCGVEIDDYARSVLVKRQNERNLVPFPVWSDIRTFNGKDWRGVADIVTGGFPCQSFSSASTSGKRADNLWGEMLRVVCEVQPKYVFAENVTRRAIEEVSEDLSCLGYRTEAVALSTEDLGGDDIRRRYWLLAYTDDKRELLQSINGWEMEKLQKLAEGLWKSDPSNYGVFDDLANRVERFRSVGNGQNPVVVITALKILAEKGG